MQSNYPLYPEWIAPLFRVTGVFETAPSHWRIFFIEVKDDTGWHYVDEKLLFAPTPLGDRTRFQQLMNEIEKANSSEQTSLLLQWISLHLPQVNLPASQPEAVRIVHFGIPPETFLKYASFADVYKIANDTRIPRAIVGSLNIGAPSSP